MDQKTTTVTLTFGDVAENHVNMQKIGKLSDRGYSLKDLKKIRAKVELKTGDNNICKIHDITKGINGESAYVLVIKSGVDKLLGSGSSDKLLKEQLELDVDKKALMRGRVVNKRARYNLCFSNYTQEPDYDNGNGRVINFKDVEYTDKLRDKIIELTGDSLVIEGNYYYDIAKCGIGFHGDSERRKVVGVRLGKSMDLVYKWFKNSTVISNPIKFTFNHGDIYIMSDKATGYDWKKRKIATLRHAAGSKKYTS